MARLEPAIANGSLLKLYRALWAPYYEAALRILGSTGTILAIGDPAHGQPTASTFTTKGEEQVAVTWSEAPSLFDTPLDLTDPASFQGIVPILSLNGTDEEADAPDTNYWSRGDGANDFAFSVGAWVNISGTARKMILAKFDATAPIQEWIFDIAVTSNALRLLCRDDSAAINVNRTADAGLTQDMWTHVIATYDGAGGATAMDTVKLYQQGIAVASTAANNAGYVAMENGTSALEFAHSVDVGPTVVDLFDGKIAGGPIGPFFTQKELAADEVRALYDLGRAGLGL